MKRILFICGLLILSVTLAFAGDNKSRRLSFSNWDNYEVSIEKVGTDGTKFIKVWGFGKKVDAAIMQAKMNAVHACLFRGLAANPSGGVSVPTPPICKDPEMISQNDAYFQEFFAPGGPFLAFINMTTDGVPSGQDRRQVKGGYKVAIYVQVMYDNLKKKMETDGIVRGLSTGF